MSRNAPNVHTAAHLGDAVRMGQMSELDTNAPATGVPELAVPILATLILVAAVANLNLAVANVALPDIGKAFDASQTGLDLVAIAYSLGLAGSVLWLGALGDRYGRKMMLLSRHGVVDPRLYRGGMGAVARGARRGSARRRSVCGYGLPDDARPDHRAVGPGRQPHEGDRHVVGVGGGSPPSGRCCRGFSSSTSGGVRCSC